MQRTRHPLSGATTVPSAVRLRRFGMDPRLRGDDEFCPDASPCGASGAAFADSTISVYVDLPVTSIDRPVSKKCPPAT